MSNFFKPLFPDLHRQLDQVFDELLHRPWGVPGSSAWLPKLDLFESAVEYVVELEVPGIAPADLSVTVSSRSVTVAGERRRGSCDAGAAARCECSVGRFERTVVLAAQVSPAGASADCRHGLLRIRLPKAAVSEPIAGPMPVGIAT